MDLNKYFKLFKWYYNKHGFVRLLHLSFKKIWMIINKREVLFCLDLTNETIYFHEAESNYSIQQYDDQTQIAPDDIENLINIKSKEVLFSFLGSFFSRDATLWLAKKNDIVVGLLWTLTGGFNGFYSIPIKNNEMIVLAVEVFPGHRGHNIWPKLLNLVSSRAAEIGISRIYLKVNILNHSMLKSMTKTQCKRMGTVRTFELFNRYITFWDK